MLKFKRMACMLLTMGIFITAFPDRGAGFVRLSVYY